LAIHIPESGIVDYQHVARRLAELIEAQGSRIKTGARVTAVRRHQKLALVETTAGEFPAEQVVNCAGLYSDRVTRLSGAQPASKIIPFRGEFYLVRPEAHHLVRMLIYPVPDPRYPFLGVHFTRRIDGRVECGPNAVLAFAREGYRNTTVNLRDMAETLGYRGSGVRAQAVAPDGSMVDDFVITETDRVINVENAPSPAATASLNIGRLVVERLAPRFE
jgi:(S)-2-hydroxyglutarate dehydrogenase